MKIRSKVLYDYLKEAGVLNGTPEEIAHAKQRYRKQYKKNWKQQKRPRKELRIEFTLKQFAAISRKALESELSRTAYARNTILAATGSEQFIPHKEQLLQILQLVSITAIATAKSSVPPSRLSEWLEQAETMLMQYLKQKT
ncbi:hypothetical protein HDF24_11480 [Mucilaginibacter sp. X4EP1]|uniref:hypothetical protein n=1 Tax=Mucilaginibacter sp. X4EP1 TaxID=2723092 RepID=UPI002166C278|nr:hypothetical protein [Mucilaginibacter sp. X4EP1]MCS3816630.1 hypothetical protein [Mucilaginibacter sp. X4EP1]